MRTMGQHIRDVFTLADRPQLLTDPDPSPEQAARIAESARFYFTLYLAFAICWAGISVRQILRHQGDDTILGYIGIASAAALAYLALRYYQKARGGNR